MTTPETELTDLDQALLTARESAAHANFFYDAFLNANVFVPVQREGKTEGSWKAVGADEKFRPLFLSLQGSPVVPVFDRLERLKTWAQGRPLDYLELRCFVFLHTLAPNVGVGLNPGLPTAHFLPAEILQQLRAALKAVDPS